MPDHAIKPVPAHLPPVLPPHEALPATPHAAIAPSHGGLMAMDGSATGVEPVDLRGSALKEDPYAGGISASDDWADFAR